jgi:hypothetical protein
MERSRYRGVLKCIGNRLSCWFSLIPSNLTLAATPLLIYQWFSGCVARSVSFNPRASNSKPLKPDLALSLTGWSASFPTSREKVVGNTYRGPSATREEHIARARLRRCCLWEGQGYERRARRGGRARSSNPSVARLVSTLRSICSVEISYRSNAVTTWSTALLFTKLASPSIP